MNYLTERVRENIKAIRQDQGRTLEELSESCGHHRTWLGKIERGERGLSVENLSEIADALEIEPTELLEERS